MPWDIQAMDGKQLSEIAAGHGHTFEEQEVAMHGQTLNLLVGHCARAVPSICGRFYGNTQHRCEEKLFMQLFKTKRASVHLNAAALHRVKPPSFK